MKVLLAADSSIYSKAALDSLLACPWPDNTEFLVLCVDETLHKRTDYWNPKSKELLIQFEAKIAEEHERLAEACTAELKERFPRCKVHKTVVEGFVVDKILEVAERWCADLIVVGSHGRKGLTRFLLGSVSEAVAGHAPCSVRIVRLDESCGEG